MNYLLIAAYSSLKKKNLLIIISIPAIPTFMIMITYFIMFKSNNKKKNGKS